jgi:hypothetical protein
MKAVRDKPVLTGIFFFQSTGMLFLRFETDAEEARTTT